MFVTEDNLIFILFSFVRVVNKQKERVDKHRAALKKHLFAFEFKFF